MLRFVDLSTEASRRKNFFDGIQWVRPSKKPLTLKANGDETYTGKERMLPPPPPPPNDLGELYPTHQDWETVVATSLKFAETDSGFFPTMQEQPVEAFNTFLQKAFYCPWLYTVSSSSEYVSIETESFDPLLNWLETVFKPVYPGDWQAYIDKVLGLIDLATRSESVVQRSTSFSSQGIVNETPQNVDWTIAYSYIALSYKVSKGTVIINQLVFTCHAYLRLNKGSARNNAQNILTLDFLAGQDWVGQGMGDASKLSLTKCPNVKRHFEKNATVKKG